MKAALYQRELRSRRVREFLMALGHDEASSTYVRIVLAVTIPLLVDSLLASVQATDFRPIEPLAAAIVELHYASCFAVPESLATEAERVIRASPIPVTLLPLLGDRVEKRRLLSRTLPWEDLLPLAVLHSFARDQEAELGSKLVKALELAIDPSRQLTWLVETDPVIVRTSVNGRDFTKVSPSPLARQAQQERLARLNRERLSNDPARNNRPEEFLKLPRPELAGNFTWWSLQLGQILGSPLLDEPRYVAMTYELADRCLKTLPNAHVQAQDKKDLWRVEDPNHSFSDRFGTVDNESLPKLARWLIKRGDFMLAEQVCRTALDHRIESMSPGAFERSLEAARKKRLAGASPRTAGNRKETP